MRKTPPSQEFSPRKLALLRALLREEGQEPAPDQANLQTRGDDDGNPEGVSPLSFGQERLWFLDQLAGGGAQYNIPSAIRLKGDLKTSALGQSLRYLVERHSVLRSAFRSDSQGRVVVAIESKATPELRVVDLQTVPADERERVAKELMREEIQRGFNLEEPPLLRGLLVQLQEQEFYLVLTLHHIAGDAWSVGTLVNEMSRAYAAYDRGREPQLPALTAEYVDYARWQRQRMSGEFLQRQLAYWREQLDGLEPLRMPSARPRPPKPSHRGAQCELTLDGELSGRLRALGRQEACTLFMVLLAGWQLLLGRYSGQGDIAVGTPISNRPKREWESVVGFFVNTLVLRTKLNLRETFRGLLKKVRETCLGAYAHQDLPFERLVEELAPARDLSQSPLIQTMFTFQNAPLPDIELTGFEVSGLGLSTGTAKLDLSIDATEAGSEIKLSLGYSTDTFDAATAEQMLESYRHLLEKVSSSPDLLLESLLWTTEMPTQAGLAVGANPPHNLIDIGHRNQSIGAVFRQVCSKYSARVAVHTEAEAVTYAQLADRADRIGQALIDCCGPHDGRVALLCGHGMDMVACILGALLANKTYVPLDPYWPIKRIQMILADTQPEFLLFEQSFAPQAMELSKGSAIKVMTVAEALEGAFASPSIDSVCQNQLAYILYTSGSTGVPKGVMQSHRNVLTNIVNYIDSLGINYEDRMTLFPSYCYDAAIMDIFGALLSGAELHPLEVTAIEPESIIDYIQTERLTVMHATPTLFRHMLQGIDDNLQLASIRAVVLGGEEAGLDVFPRFRTHFPPGCVLVNGLGPTECTIALQYRCHAASQISGRLPIGKTVNGIEARIVDGNGQPGAIKGEIVLTGEQLALGYWCRPDLTAQSFLPAEKGLRAYRTGDLGRILFDGNLEYLGRKDFQVKILGTRVELSEIEVALSRVPGVLSSVVIVCEQQGEKQLWAYFTSTGQVSVDALRQELSSSLPRYMLPTRFIRVHEIPMLPNGKVDRQTLLNLDESRVAPHSFKLPRTWLETALVDIWQQVLNIRPISIDDDFFALGGHSLLAPRLFNTILRTLNCRLPLSVLFEAPTIELMASRIAASGDHKQTSPLVCLQPSGHRIPLFLVHPAGGDVLCFRHLAMALGQHQPVYGLQDPKTAVGEPPTTSIPEMAAMYLRAIKTVEPQGPRILGGWSFGGVVAYEMARQSAMDDKAVKTLLLLDAWAPERDLRDMSLDDPSLLAWIGRVEFNVKIEVEELKFKIFDEQVSLIADRIGATGRQREFVVSQLSRGRDIVRARRETLRSYDPGLYDGSITVFRAIDTELSEESAHQSSPDLGWARFCRGPIRTISVPGTHRTITMPPHVEKLGMEITAHLNQVFPD